MESLIAKALESCPIIKKKLAYGTAGFRAEASLLDAVFVKVGLLAALRSLQTTLVGDRPVLVSWLHDCVLVGQGPPPGSTECLEYQLVKL